MDYFETDRPRQNIPPKPEVRGVVHGDTFQKFGEIMSAMFTNGVGQHAKIPQFDNYMDNPINTCQIKMATWYVYANQQILKRTLEDKYFRNMMKS